MTIVESVLHKLLEAKKSYKNHIPKALRYKMDQALQRLVTLNIRRSMPELDADGVVDTNSYIDYIEKTFRRHNPNVLLKYVEWVIMASVENLKTTQTFTEIFLFPRKFSETLLTYHRYLNQGVDMEEHEKDIYNLETFSAVDEIVTKYPDPDVEVKMLKSEKAEVTYENSKLRVIKINTFEAAKHFGSGGRGRSTPWCIAATNGFWTRYWDDGYRFYFVFDKVAKERYAVSFNMMIGWNQQNKILMASDMTRLMDKFPVLDKLARQETASPNVENVNEDI